MPTKSHYVIVVGVDYSEVSRLALAEALRVASERAASEVHVVHVETGSGFVPHEALQRLQDFVSQEVTAFQRQLSGLPLLSIERVVPHLRAAAPSREVCQLAADLEADLVVVGTQGHSAIVQFMLGSVAHAVVNLAPCPVLIVRPKQHLSAVPAIEPPCPRCLAVREQSNGRELWCEQHRARHGQRHTYHQDDRVGQETNFPLVFDER